MPRVRPDLHRATSGGCPYTSNVLPPPSYGRAPVSALTYAGQPEAVAPTPALTVGDIVQRFKNMTTTRYIAGVRQSGWPPFRRRLWHRNHYEHVVRDEPSLDQIREYIVNNPAGWHSDPENPAAPPI